MTAKDVSNEDASLTGEINEKEKLNGDAHSPDDNTDMQEGKTARGSFPRRVFETMVLYAGFICVGLIFGLMGPSFLDLELLTGGTTDQVSFTFIGGSVSGVMGAIVAGALIRKFNAWLLLSGAFSALVVLQAAVPWSRSIAVLAVLSILRGFFCVFCDAGGNVTLLSIWGEDNGPWMQALHFLFGVGGLLGPLVAKPFIYTTPEVNNTAGDNNATDNNSTTAAPSNPNVDPDEMKVWIAYLISSALILAVAVALFAVFLSGERKFRQMRKKEEKKEEEIKDRKFQWTIAVMMMCMIFCYCIIEINYFNFIVVYLVKHLGINKSKATTMNAAFWGSFTCGRALGIPIAMVLRPQVMLALSVTGTVVFLSPQPFAALLPEWALWLSMVGLGLSLSPTFATAITWTEHYIVVTGMVGASFMIAGSLGDLVGPVSIGILFQKYGAGALICLLFAVSLLMISIFIPLQIIAYRHGERKSDSKDISVTEISPMTEIPENKINSVSV